MSQEILQKLVGAWEGTCRTWLRPGEPPDESSVAGRFETLLDGQFLRHTYRGQFQGQLRTGEETIAFNSVTQQFQIAWIDSFHMNYALMFSVGEASETGFVVRGEYDVAPGEPAWGWKTVLHLAGDELTITAYNVSPDGVEEKAVETRYLRQ